MGVYAGSRLARGHCASAGQRELRGDWNQHARRLVQFLLQADQEDGPGDGQAAVLDGDCRAGLRGLHQARAAPQVPPQQQVPAALEERQEPGRHAAAAGRPEDDVRPREPRHPDGRGQPVHHEGVRRALAGDGALRAAGHGALRHGADLHRHQRLGLQDGVRDGYCVNRLSVECDDGKWIFL